VTLPSILGPMSALDRLVRALSAAGTTVRTEVIAGLTTFLAMAYILFVQPTVLARPAWTARAVLTATCLTSGPSPTLLMGVLAELSDRDRSGDGHNFFFTFTVVVARGTPWPVAARRRRDCRAAFVLVAAFGVRDRRARAVPEPMRHAIGVGIGLLVTLIGLEWSGIIVQAPGTYVALGRLSSSASPPRARNARRLAILMARGVKGALLIGMLISTGAALALASPNLTAC